MIRDGGSYSYADLQLHKYFTGTESHSTVQFDTRDQMPRIGRFLFGDWLTMSHVSEIDRDGEKLIWSGSYTDYEKAKHWRQVIVERDRWEIVDRVSGFRHNAVVRWRLAPVDWKLTEAGFESDLATIQLQTTDDAEATLTTGLESRYYMQLSDIPVIELNVCRPSEIRTTIRLK